MNRICRGVFAQLSRPLKHRREIHDFTAAAGEGEPKYGAARFIGVRPQPAVTELRAAVLWLKGCSQFRPDFVASFISAG
jgi:hypothetical protein